MAVTTMIAVSGAMFAPTAQAAPAARADISVTTASTCFTSTAATSVATPKDQLTTTLATGNKSGVFDKTALSGQQVDMAETVAKVGSELGVSRRGIRIAIAIAMQESSLNPRAVNKMYIGLYQQLADPTSGLYTEYQRTDAVGAARMFFEQLVKRVPKYETDKRTDWEVGEVVQETQVGQNVKKWQGLAEALTAKFVPGPADTAAADNTSAKKAADKKAAAKKAAAKKAKTSAASTTTSSQAGKTKPTTAAQSKTEQTKAAQSKAAVAKAKAAKAKPAQAKVKISGEDLPAAKSSASSTEQASYRQSAINKVRPQALRGPGSAFAAPIRVAAVPDESDSSSVLSTETQSATSDSASVEVSTTAAVDVPPSDTGSSDASSSAATSTEVPSTEPAQTSDDQPTGSTEVVTTDVPSPTSNTNTSGTKTTDVPSTEPVTTTPVTKPTDGTKPTTPDETSSTKPSSSTSTSTAPTEPTTVETPDMTPIDDPIDSVDPAVVPGPVDVPVPDDSTDPDLLGDGEYIPEQTDSSGTGDVTTENCSPDSPNKTPKAPDTNGGSTAFDPGRIISDEVFYNTKAMTAGQIRTFVNQKGADCTVDDCLKNLRLSTNSVPADKYCDAYRGGNKEDVASILTKVSIACGINPQVMLVTLQKESGLLTRSDVTADSYNAAWGWHCPDTGPGGSANCDPQYAGFFNQAFGMAKQWSRYKVDPDNYNYQAGETVKILWNVAESGCGGAQVTIKNTATASLYNYTPYQPNTAALAAYPGVGDKCSAYGNRNFFFLYQKYFGVTGGGVPASIAIKNGVNVTIPASPYVTAGLAGKVVKAPNKKVAEGIAAGFASIGLPYVWGGGTASGKADQGCGRGGGESNSCAGIVGFDCSGLTGYVLAKAGFATGTNSDSQRSAGKDVPWIDALPGDIIGYSGHVAIYLGYIDGTEYLLEAPDVGSFVQIRPVYRSNGGVPVDSVLHRYWK